jgi:hypothetical protein
VNTAALLLVSSAMLRKLSSSNELKARAVAASSPESGFCSDLIPSVDEKVPSFGSPRPGTGNWTTPPTPTTSFRAELLTAMRTAQAASACQTAVSLVMVCTCFSYGANVNGLIVSNSSISMSLKKSAT